MRARRARRRVQGADDAGEEAGGLSAELGVSLQEHVERDGPRTQVEKLARADQRNRTHGDMAPATFSGLTMGALALAAILMALAAFVLIRVSAASRR